MARPRQADIDQRLLDAWKALSSEMAYEDITMTLIAARAGVGKPALYRRFPTKAHLAFASGVIASAPPRLVNRGSFEADLLPAVVALVDSLHEVPREVFADQIATAIADPDFAERVQDTYARPALDQVARLWGRALQRGEVEPDLDGRAALNDLAGALIFDVMVRHHTPTEDELRATVARFVRGVAPS